MTAIEVHFWYLLNLVQVLSPTSTMYGCSRDLLVSAVRIAVLLLNSNCATWVLLSRQVLHF